MNVQEVMAKANADEELTEDEVKVYQANVKSVKHTYGKYGTLAKIYLEEHNKAKLWALAGDLSEYLHGVDDAAEKMYDTLYETLSSKERYKRTGDYLEDVRRMNEMKNSIEEEILSEIVYVG